MHRSRQSTDMTQGCIWKQLLLFALPLLVGQIFQQLYNTIDSVVVGRDVGKEALAAVGATGNVVNALINFFSGLATGAGVVISQYFGARDQKKVHDAVHTAVAMTLLMAVICTAVGMLISYKALEWMDTPEDVVGHAAAYLQIYFAGVSGLMLYNIGSGILRAVGDSRRPLYFLIFSACLNLALDLVFVCVLGMGVEGVAYATIIAQFLSALLTFFVLCRSQECYRFSLRDLKLDWSMLRQILKLGIPTGLQLGITALSNVFVQSYINAFQSSCMAGWTSYNRLDAFAWLPMLALGMANTTFVGQNLGAGQLERAKKGTRTALLMSLAGTAAIVLPLMLFSDAALRLFNDDPEVLRYGHDFVRYISLFYIPYCLTQIYSGALRGAGDSVRPMVICLSSFVVFRQIYLFVGTRFIDSHIFVGLSYPMGWVLSSTAMYIVYKRGTWEKKLKIAPAETTA